MQRDSLNGGGYGGGASVPPRPADEQPPFVPEPEQEGLTLRDYLSVLWRRKWIILLVVVVATASAFYFSYRQAKVYEANADLIYEKPLDISNPLTGQAYTDPNERNLELQSVGSVLASPDMQSRANGLLKEKGVAVSGFAVSAAPVQNTAAGSASTLANVVRITATSHVAELAKAAANAYASAYIDWRKERVQAQISSGIDALKKKLAGYEGPATVSTEYLVMAQRLQDLQLLAATATGNFRVLVPATAPETPVSPKPLRSAILGFGVGLFAAIGLAFLLEQFDTRLRHADEAARILRRPILGRIPRISKKLLGESAVVALTQPDGHPAEAFRLLRTNLEFMRVDEDVKSLLVTSSVQGEGKSVCVANLAVTLAMGGKKVFIVDADLRRPRQHKYFGLENSVGVSTVVTGQTSLDDALHKVRLEPVTGANEVDFKTWAGGSESLSRIYVLTSGPLPPNPGEIVSSRRFAAVIETLAEEADVVLVDSPAMLAVGDTAALASLVDGLVFLVDMQRAKRPMLEQAADQLVRLPCRSLGIVLRVDGAKSGGGYYSSYRYYEYADGNGKRRGRRSKGAASARADVSRRAPG
jgi:Mrp family chromosome partitioning ATPase/capsular polysaccharide biosynthesis protein